MNKFECKNGLWVQVLKEIIQKWKSILLEHNFAVSWFHIPLIVQTSLLVVEGI